MATGSLDANGIWQYGEDDSETTFSALLNKLGSSVTTQIGVRKVLQVVYASTTTTVGNNSSTQADTTLTATITPRSSTSKILVLTSQSIFKSSGNAENQVNLYLYRNSTQIQTQALNQLGSGTAISFQSGRSSMYLDAPATTSATTYKTRFSNYYTGSFVYVQQYNEPSQIVLIEVAA